MSLETAAGLGEMNRNALRSGEAPFDRWSKAVWVALMISQPMPARYSMRV